MQRFKWTDQAQPFANCHYYHEMRVTPNKPQYRASLPIVPVTTFRLPERECGRLDAIADRILRDEPALPAVGAFGTRVRSGLSGDPALIISNNNDIPLVEANAVSPLEYRMSLLGQSGDMFALRGKRCREFEHYREYQLGLGALDIIELSDIQPGKRVAFGKDSQNLNRIVEHVRRASRRGRVLNLVPFIGVGSIWALGMMLSEYANTEVNIAAAPPRLTNRVNDKLWFAAFAGEVLGQVAVPPTRAAYGPAALAGLVLAFAKRYPQVVVKVPNSAGSAGNVKLDSASVLSNTPFQVRDSLVDLLRSFGWRDRYPLMVEVWDTAVLSSPSVQLWIPDRTEGAPVVEGVFDQVLHLSGASADVFAGATKALLSHYWEQRLIEGALKLATVLQRIGYFGRLSFDTVLCGEDMDGAELHWIECNGRWGGVSIPMTLMNRLFAEHPAKELVIVQHDVDTNAAIAFDQGLKALGGLLYQHGQRQEGIVLPTPYTADNGRAAQVIACGGSLSAVKAIIEEANRRLSSVALASPVSIVN